MTGTLTIAEALAQLEAAGHFRYTNKTRTTGTGHADIGLTEFVCREYRIRLYADGRLTCALGRLNRARTNAYGRITLLPDYY